MSIFLKDEELILDVTVDRDDFTYVLETHLPKYEAHELYEECAEIVKALEFLKKKKNNKWPHLNSKTLQGQHILL